MSKADDWRPKLKKIDDVLVEDDLPFLQGKGRTVQVHMVVGRPKPLPERDYYCPIQAEGFFKGVKLAFGVGPVDSLMNAMDILHRYSRYISGMIDDLEGLPEPALRPYRPSRRRFSKR